MARIERAGRIAAPPPQVDVELPVGEPAPAQELRALLADRTQGIFPLDIRYGGFTSLNRRNG